MMDVLEWFRGVEEIETDGLLERPPIEGPRLVTALLFNKPVVVQADEALDWSLTIWPVQKTMKTDFGAMPDPDPYREERKRERLSAEKALRDDWLPHIKNATVLRDSCDESDVRLRHDSATGLDVEEKLPLKHTSDAVLLTVMYAACPNASYNSAHYDSPQGCKWCARRKAVLEYLKNSS
jgi:hypothetical protein